MHQTFSHYLRKNFKGSSVKKNTLFLLKVYKRFNLICKRFSKSNRIECPKGCGYCCQHHEPFISLTEAEAIAAWLLYQKINPYQRFSHLQDRSCCIFFDENTPFHCSLYPIRPLLCRSFGFMGSKKKQGERCYTPCKQMIYRGKNPMPTAGRWKKIVPASLGGDLLEKQQAGSNYNTIKISDAIYQSWNKLNLFLLFSQEEKKRKGRH